MMTRSRASRQDQRPDPSNASPRPEESRWARIDGTTEITCPLDNCGKKYRLKNLKSHWVSCAKRNAGFDILKELETRQGIRHVPAVGQIPGHWTQRQNPSVVPSSSRRHDPNSRSGSPQVARTPSASRVTSERSSASRGPSLSSGGSAQGPARIRYQYSPSPSPSAASDLSERSRPGYSSLRSASVGNISKTAQPVPHPALTIRRVTSMPEDLHSIRPSRALSLARPAISGSHAQVIPAKRAPPSTNSSSTSSSRETSVGSVIGDAIRADQRLFAEVRKARQPPAPGPGVVGHRSRRASTPLVL